MSEGSVRVPEVDVTDPGMNIDCEIVERAAISYFRQRVDAKQFVQSVDTGLNEAIHGHHNMPHVVDYRTAIGLLKVSGHVPFRAAGRREGLSTATAGDDLWNGTATSLVYADQVNGEQMTLVSTSANDTAAGSGAQQVDVHYLDKNGVETYERVTMNGVTPVNTTATDIRFPQYIHVQRVGTLGAVAAGAISLYRTGDAARVYLLIPAGTNVSLNAQRMVPAGKTLYINFIMASATSQKPISLRLRATCDYEGVLTENVFIFNEIFELDGSAVFMNLEVPRTFPAFCIIKATAYSTTAGGSAAMSYGGWLE